MPQFSYRARNSQGELVEGVLDCADRAVAIQQIELQRCIPVRIELLGAEPKGPKVVRPPAGGRLEASTQNLKIPHGQLLIFTEQLAHLLKAGMTLDEALSILEKRLKQPRVQQMTHSLHQSLFGGRGRSKRCAAANSPSPGQAFDAGKGPAGSGAASFDLSGISRPRWRRSRYNFYHVHGTAVERVHGANRRRASIAYTDSAASSSCDYELLVGRRAGRGGFNRCFPRPCPQ